MAANKVVISTPGPAGDAGVNFKGVWASDVQYFVRDVVRYAVDGNLYTCISTPDSVGITPLNTDYFAVFVKISDARNWAITDQYSQVIDESGTAGYSSKHYALQSEEWASKTDGAVRNDDNSADVDYSSKSWAIGGTGVTGTANAGAAKQWATTTGAAVDGTEYSSKEYAIGTTVAVGSSKDWATITGGTVDGTEYSAKEYSTGTTVPTGSSKEWATNAGSAEVVATEGYSSKAYAQDTANDIGSSVDWATKTSGIVASTDYSAKEFAVGSQASTGGSSKNWAQQTGADVTGAASGSKSAKSWATETGATAPADGSAKEWATQAGSAEVATGEGYSAKAYAHDTANDIGSSIDWATKTDSIVNSTDYSSKEWATGTQTRGAASGGSSKDWATYTGGTVDDAGYSSKYHAEASEDSNLTSQSYAVDTGATVQTYSGGVGSSVADTYSSKEWAIGTTVPDGSSKEWSTSTTEVAGGLKGAKGYAEDAAQSAVEAAAATNIEGTSITFAIALG